MAQYPRLDELKAKLDALRPLDQDKVQAIREKFRLDWTYHSNAIEGNPLTISETSFFIREGLTSKGRPLSAYLEAKNHLEALDYLDSVVSDKTQVTDHLIRQYHAMLFRKIDQIILGSGAERREVTIVGGEYKKENNHVIRLDGKIREFTDWLQVPGAMERLRLWYADNETILHPVELATELHHKFVSIHPFLDGNGRVGRLLLNTVLMQRGYTPAIIPVEEKKQYLEGLQSADDGTYEPLYRLVEVQVSKTLQLMLDVVEGREAFDFDDLARMLSNMAKTALEIDRDLGPAIQDPIARSISTGGRLINEVESLLSLHATAAKAPTLRFNVMKSVGIPGQISATVNQLKTDIGGNTSGSIQLQIKGATRTVPQLDVAFHAFSGRYQVALFAHSVLGMFANNNQETPSYATLQKILKGSISFDEWDKKELHDFVLDYLKQMYLRFGEEIERRKKLIGEEEAERAKYLRK